MSKEMYPEKENSATIKVSAIDGTGHSVQANKIEVTGVQYSQNIPPLPAEHLPKQGCNVPPKIQVQESSVSRSQPYGILRDNRPSDYEYAVLSQHVYRGSQLKKGDCLEDDTNKKWEEWTIHQVRQGKSGYFGAIYIKDRTRQIVLAHRGTNNIGALWEDFMGVYLSKLSKQKEEAYTFLKKVIEETVGLVKNQESNQYGYHLSFTGHSLGAFLAELSVFYAHDSFRLQDVNAVTFESPGSEESMIELQPNRDLIQLQKLDIIGYVSYPNLINTCNKHVGTLYQIEPHLGEFSWPPAWSYLKQAHSKQRIVDLFRTTCRNTPLRHYMLDWPLGSQRKIFFDKAKLIDGRYKLENADNVIENNKKSLEKEFSGYYGNSKEEFRTRYKGHYKREPVLSGVEILPLRHFLSSMQDFLKAFYDYKLKVGVNEHLCEQFASRWKQRNIPEEVTNYLLGYEITEDSRGIKMLVLNTNKLSNAEVHNFRCKLSVWLEEDSFSIVDLLTLPQNLDQSLQSSVDVIAAIVAPGVKLTRSTLENAEAVGIDLSLRDDIDEEECGRRTERLLTAVQRAGIKKVESYIFAPGAVVEGCQLKNVSSTGIKFKSVRKN